MIHIAECTVGLLIEKELVWDRIRNSGKSLIVTTLTQSLGTFLTVSAIFSVVFYACGISIYLAFVFGSIALATAPALSIVKEFKTRGPVTDTLIPMAALDDMVGAVVFFTTITVVSGSISGQKVPAVMLVVVMLLPLAIGALTGFPTAFLLKRCRSGAAGLFTAVYISSRALGKCFGAWFGASITHSPETVRKYLGLTLLPHSGVSLVFTGISASALAASAPENAAIIQGTIAAAAVINEIIAVVAAKKGVEWAGEFNVREAKA